MASWKEDLADCFDPLDRLFSSHAMDEGHAFELLVRLRAEGVGRNELSNAVRELLASDGCSVQHIELQVREVEHRFAPWLPD